MLTDKNGHYSFTEVFLFSFSFGFSTLFFGLIFFRDLSQKSNGACYLSFSVIFVSFVVKKIYSLFCEINVVLSTFAIINRF